MSQGSDHQTMPYQIIDLMGQTASHFGGQSAIDPWLHEPALLRSLVGVERRVGLIRDAALCRQLAPEEPQLELRHADVFEAPAAAGDAKSRKLQTPLFQEHSPEQFDIVLWGLPWGEMVQWGNRRHRVEAFMLDRAVELLTPGGVAICLVPPNVLMAPLWKSTRQRIMRDYWLEMTVDLPHDLFAPLHLLSTMVVVRRTTPRQTVFMAEYSAGHRELLENLQNGTGDFHVASADIHDRWDRNFHDPRHREAIAPHLEGFPVRTLGELAEVIPGLARHQNYLSDDGEYLLVTGATISRGGLQIDSSAEYLSLTSDPQLVRHVLRPGDIVLSAIEPKLHVYRDSDPPAVAAQSIIVIRTNDNDYLASYLSTDEGQSLFEAQVDRKGSRLGRFARITAAQLRCFQIPIIPLSQPQLLSSSNLNAASREELERLSAELLAARRENLQLRHRLEQEEARRDEASERALEAEQRWQQSGVTQVFIESQFAAVNERLSQIMTSVEQLHETIKCEFLSAKASNREIEEKVALMRGTLDRAVTQLVGTKDVYATYVDVVKAWLEHWERLEPKSLTFLASGEHLFDVLNNSHALDHSPFVLQYCRALENELLCRLFFEFQDDFRNRISDTATFLVNDLQNDKVRQFAHALQRDRRDHTLGTMARVLGFVRPGGRTLAASPLLTDLSQFLIARFGLRILSEDFVSQVQTLADDFRNRAAHPDILDCDKANECRQLVRGAMAHLLERYLNMGAEGEIA